MSSIQSSVSTPLVDTTTQSSSYYSAYHPVSSSSDSSYYQSPHSPATNYYSNYSSSLPYSPAYTSNSYNHYSQSTPMWQSSAPAPAYQHQFQPKSLNESYVAQDSAYYSHYSSTSASAESSGLEESKKRAAVDDATVNDENDEKTSRKRPRIEKFAYYISAAENESACKLCGVEFESVSKCLMHVHIIHKQRDANECPICCEYSFN